LNNDQKDRLFAELADEIGRQIHRAERTERVMTFIAAAIGCFIVLWSFCYVGVLAGVGNALCFMCGCIVARLR
jgi:hypothetical protein